MQHLVQSLPCGAAAAGRGRSGHRHVCRLARSCRSCASRRRWCRAVRRDALQRARLCAPCAGPRSAAGWCWSPRPRGYGKSTLAAQWSDADSRAGGWVQLGHGDNDPVVLLARVAAALERTGSVREELLEELSRRSPRIDEVVLPLLAADLGERDPFVLVLDDVARHHRPEEPRDPLVSHRPGSIRLAAGAGVARRSGSAARPPARRRGSVRDRGHAPSRSTRTRPARRRCERWTRVVGRGGRSAARADGRLGCGGRAGDAVAAWP